MPAGSSEGRRNSDHHYLSNLSLPRTRLNRHRSRLGDGCFGEDDVENTQQGGQQHRKGKKERSCLPSGERGRSAPSARSPAGATKTAAPRIAAGPRPMRSINGFIADKRSRDNGVRPPGHQHLEPLHLCRTRIYIASPLLPFSGVLPDSSINNGVFRSKKTILQRTPCNGSGDFSTPVTRQLA